QRLYLGEHVRRNRAVDLYQRDRIATLAGAAEMEGGDVDLGVAKQARKVADETRFVLVGDVDHRLAEFGIDADALDVHKPRLAVVIHRARHRTFLPFGGNGDRDKT